MTVVWGASIAWYLFLAGASAGAFITAAFVEFKYPENTKTRIAGRVMAPIFVCIGLVLLMVDAEAGLHNPLRFVFLLSNPGSVMTIGVYLLAAYMPIAFIVLLLEVLKKAVPRWLVWAGIALAAGVAMYTGFLLGVLDTHPLWSNSVLPVLFFVSALSAGSAATGVVGLVVDRAAFEKMRLLKKWHVGMVCVEAALLVVMLLITVSYSPEGFQSVASLTQGTYAPLFWFGLVLIGLVVPFAVQLYQLTSKSADLRPTVSAALGFTGEAGALVGGYMLRFLIISAAIPVVFIH